ncbi:MAG: segregation/condensation protein A [Bernardetiaceae bacterium]|nr:segregation/condensation protein A [Bernardetiaceae bacterium]
MNAYEIKLPIFEGPFDLLLFFIERDELDIYDIPIAKITGDFLAYMRALEQLNIEVTSDFILMAATLMSIKAKMLIPREELNKGSNDPRKSLIDKILEYKRYKPVLEKLKALEEEEEGRWARGNLKAELKQLSKEIQGDMDLKDLDLYKLLRAYQEVIADYELRRTRIHSIRPYPYSVSGQRDFMIRELQKRERWHFKEILVYSEDRILVVFNFLAILELLQRGVLGIEADHSPEFNDFMIYWQGDNEENDEHTATLPKMPQAGSQTSIE